MSIQLLAADIASRIPAMAQDCAINNAAVIEGLIRNWIPSLNPKSHIEASTWESVDWTRRNSEIAEELGCREPLVSAWRYRLNKPKVTKLSGLPWNTVDWTQPDGVIAAAIGTTAGNVRHYRTKAGAAVAQRRKSTISPDRIASVDWARRSDVMIARELNVTRERIRQIRQERHLPACKWEGRSSDWIEFATWVEDHGRNMDAAAVIDAYPRATPGRRVRREILKRMGWSVARVNYNQKYPADAFNWELPNIVLSMVWGCCDNYVGGRRCDERRRAPRWHAGGGFSRLFDDAEFQAALRSEIKKARDMGRTVDEPAIDRWMTWRRNGVVV